MNTFDVENTVQPKPGRGLRRWGFVLMLLGLIVGLLVVIVSFASLYRSTGQNMLVRGLVPGTLTFTVDEPGEYILIYEFRSVVDGQVIRNIIAPPPFTLSLQDPQGDEVAIEPYLAKYRYETPTYGGVAINRFVLDVPGEYTLTADSVVSRESVLAVGRDYAIYKIGGVIGLLSSCMFFLVFFVGMILFIVGWVMRSNPPKPINV